MPLLGVSRRSREKVASIGVDIIEIERIEEAILRWGDRFLRRIYTEAELRQSGREFSSLAARFAGKEAVMKVLGTGGRGVGWREIEIVDTAQGKPEVKLHGRALDLARASSLCHLSISLSDSKQYAIAVALGEPDPISIP